MSRVVHVLANFDSNEGITRAALEVAIRTADRPMFVTNRVVAPTPDLEVCAVGGSGSAFSLSHRRAILALIERFDPDLIHLHGGVFAPMWGVPLRNARPTVVTVYGWPRPPSIRVILGRWREVRKSAVLKFRVLLSGLVPGGLLRVAVRWSGTKAVLTTDSRVVTELRHTVPVRLLPVGAREVRGQATYSMAPRIVFAGRAETARGIDVAIQAMALILTRLPEAKLRLLLLPSAQLPEIERLAETLPSGSVEIVAGAAHDLATEYANSSVAVFPFKYDYTTSLPPLTVLEAMAAGLPVIGTDVECLRQILVDHENGRVVRPANVDGLAEAVISISGDQDVWERLAAGARRTIRRQWSWEAAAAATTDIYLAGALETGTMDNLS